MKNPQVKPGQDGFVLIVAMILMVVMGIFAMNSMRSATVGERLAGNYRERSQAFSAAEQALSQGQALLNAHALTCLENVCDNTTLEGTAASSASATLPSVWPTDNANTSAITTVTTYQKTNGRYLINALTHANFAKDTCRPYSVMGRGVGINANDVVLLQTVVYICETE